MVAAKKIESALHTHQHSAKLESLLLDINYKKKYSNSNKTHAEEMKHSRIEAEFQMEKMFMNLF